MKTQYQFIHFEKYKDKPKTSAWLCINNKSFSTIGIIEWHSGWRQYCFFTNNPLILSAGCLDDISDFIKQLKEMK